MHERPFNFEVVVANGFLPFGGRVLTGNIYPAEESDMTIDDQILAVVAQVDLELPLPAYEQVLKASHTFNLLDARHAISVTERQRFILRMRTLSRAVAQTYYDSREALGFPIGNNSDAAVSTSGDAA